VYTSYEFERMLCPNGPTSGKLVTKRGSPPRSVAILHCVGRGSEGQELGYCSAVCCMNSLKLAHAVRHKTPEVDVTLVHRDWCLPGREYHRFRDDLARGGARFLRFGDPGAVSVRAAGDRLMVEVATPGVSSQRLEVDMAVLSAGMSPGADSARLAELLRIPLDADGFFQVEHGRVAPVSTPLEGVFIAGSARGPADVQASVASGAAAAGQILSALLPGEKLQLPAIVAAIDPDVCGGCRLCLGRCPYQAISFDEQARVCAVNDALCKGCGTCDAGCPTGAAQSRHFTRAQLFAEIEGLLR
jgi:heterodisulfide reductase subunit A